MLCVKCNKTAAKRWSPDLDIRGIGMCLEHEEEVMQDIVIANISNEWKLFRNKYKI